ncbi:MAG: hypothetical protein ACPIOQ_38675, partial [Promethearchaeia archaeon]
MVRSVQCDTCAVGIALSRRQSVARIARAARSALNEAEGADGALCAIFRNRDLVLCDLVWMVRPRIG